jgi:hypothetical protein
MGSPVANASVTSPPNAIKLIKSSTSNPIPLPSKSHLKPNGVHRPVKSPPHQPATIEYSSSAPLPPSSSNHVQNGEEDEDVPSHLYEKLPAHTLESDGRGGKVPDYLRMILMCEPP